MKSPNKALVSLWTGEMYSHIKVLREIAIHDMSEEEINIAKSILLSISCTVESLQDLIKKAGEKA